MLDRCPNCEAIKIGGECHCVPAKAWVLFAAFVLSVLVLAVIKDCAKSPDDADLQPVTVSDTVAPMRHLFIAALLCIPSTARAERPIPACAWTPAARVELGRMVQLESTSSEEYRTFAWALARRWRGRPAVRSLTFAQSVTAFSWILRRHRDTGYNGASRRQHTILTSRIPAGVAEVLETWSTGALSDGCVNGMAWDWHAPPRGRFHCPGFNKWLRMPSNIVLEEGRCG